MIDTGDKFLMGIKSEAAKTWQDGSRHLLKDILKPLVGKTFYRVFCDRITEVYVYKVSAAGNVFYRFDTENPHRTRYEEYYVFVRKYFSNKEGAIAYEIERLESRREQNRKSVKEFTKRLNKVKRIKV